MKQHELGSAAQSAMSPRFAVKKVKVKALIVPIGRSSGSRFLARDWRRKRRLG